MKKEYMQPLTDVIRLHLETSFCLAASDQEGDGEQFGKGADVDADWDD